jgi:hypothetical protein
MFRIKVLPPSSWLRRWRCRQYVSHKRWNLPISLHGFKTQKDISVIKKYRSTSVSVVLSCAGKGLAKTHTIILLSVWTIQYQSWTERDPEAQPAMNEEDRSQKPDHLSSSWTWCLHFTISRLIFQDPSLFFKSPKQFSYVLCVQSSSPHTYATCSVHLNPFIVYVYTFISNILTTTDVIFRWSNATHSYFSTVYLAQLFISCCVYPYQ